MEKFSLEDEEKFGPSDYQGTEKSETPEAPAQPTVDQPAAETPKAPDSSWVPPEKKAEGETPDTASDLNNYEPPAAEWPEAEKKEAPEEKPDESADKEKEKQLENSPEMAEVKKTIDVMPREEKMGLWRGFKSIGFYAQEGKSRLFAGALEKAAGGKNKSESVWGHFAAGLAKTYRRDEEEANKKLEEARKDKKTHFLMGSAYIGGNAVKYGRIVGDVVGWTTAMPLRYAMLGSAGFARIAEGMKEGRFENKDLIDKTRIQDADQAAEEAYKVYEEAKAAAGGGPVDSKTLQDAYNKELPSDLVARLNKNTLTAKVNIAGRIVQDIAKWNIERSAGKIQAKLDEIQFDNNLKPAQKTAEQKKVMAKYERRLKDWDRAVTQYGTADALAMGARYAELAGKTAVLAMGAETVIYGAIHSISNLLSHSDLNHAAETAAAAHGTTAESASGIHGATVNAGIHPNIEPIHGAPAPHEFVTAQADKLAQPAPGHIDMAPHEAAQHAAEAIPRGESIPPPAYEIHADYTATVPEHGNVWEAAKSIGLNHKEFVDAWANPESVIHTTQGPVQIHNLYMVHPGDIVKFIPGEKGLPGHFEVMPGSGQPMGTGLPIEHIGKVEPMPMTGGHPIEAAFSAHPAPEIPSHPTGPIGPLEAHPTAPGQEAWAKEAFGKPVTGHENVAGYPDHYPPQIPTHPDHPAGNPIWENTPTHAAEHAPIMPEHPGLPHEVTGSVEAHAGNMATHLNMSGYNGSEYMAQNYRSDVLNYALAHHLDMQLEMSKFQAFGQQLSGNIKLYEQIHADPSKAEAARALLESIKASIAQATKTYGNGVIDKAKLPDFLK